MRKELKVKMNKNEGASSPNISTPMGWYPWYPRDFASSITVRSMSFTARAIYRELLDIQWENGCLTDVERLLNILAISQEQWSEFAPYLDELFPDGRNIRLDQLRTEAIERQKAKKSAGQKSAESRRSQVQKPKKTKRYEQVMNKCSTDVQQVFNSSSTDVQPNTNTNTNRLLTLDKSSVETRDVWIIPECLREDRFLASWSAFVQHRKDIKKPISAVGGKALLHKLSKHDAELAADALDESLANGWQGVFPEKVERSERPGRTRSGSNERNSMLARIGSSIEELE
jgi:uncharacterized protein YdaU (DUF1376 family)